MDIYKCRPADNTLKFIEKMLEELPFPIQRIQSDRGLEFFAQKVQEKFMEYGIKFRPVKPASLLQLAVSAWVFKWQNPISNRF